MEVRVQQAHANAIPLCSYPGAQHRNNSALQGLRLLLAFLLYKYKPSFRDFWKMCYWEYLMCGNVNKLILCLRHFQLPDKG